MVRRALRTTGGLDTTGRREKGGCGAALVIALTITAGASTAIAQESADWRAQIEHARSLVSTARYEDAEAELQRLAARVDSAKGPGSLEVARIHDLLVSVLIRRGLIGQSGTLELAENVVRTKEKWLGATDADLAPSLRTLAEIQTALGEYASAVASGNRAVGILDRSAAGSPGNGMADTLDVLARALTLVGRSDEALQVIARSLDIKESRGPDNDAGIARSLAIQALALQRKGDYAKPRAILDRAVALLNSADPNAPDMIDVLSLLGQQQRFEGNLVLARDTHDRAIRLAERTLGPDHPDLITYLPRQVVVAQDLGELTRAVAVSERMLAVSEHAFAPDSMARLSAMNVAAGSYFYLGDYTRARTLYERALASYRRRQAADQFVAIELYNLALLHARLGDFAEARRQFVEARGIWRRLLGPDHPTVGRAYQALAEMLTEQGLDLEARVNYERALAIQQRSLGSSSTELAQTLSNLAITLDRLGSLKRASDLSNRALAIWEHADGSGTVFHAEALAAHGQILLDSGDDAGALAAYTRALDIRQRVEGPSHPDVAQAQAGRGAALLRLGSPAEAFESAMAAERIGREHLELSLGNLPERQALGYAAKRPKGLDLAASIATGPDQVRAIVDGVIRNRAIVLDEMAARHQDPGDAHRPDIEPLRTALNEARQRLANLVVRGPNERQPEQYITLLDDARRAREQAERALAEVSAPFRDGLARKDVGLDEVRRSLPDNAALVGFVRYDRAVAAPMPAKPRDPPQSAAGRRWRTVPSYGAFVIRAGRSDDITWVPVGSVAAIDGLVGRWRGEVAAILTAGSEAEAESTYRRVGTALRRRVWDPLAVPLTGASTVFVVPDGTLNLVSIAALPSGPVKYLVEDGPVLHYLSAERDLVSAQAISKRGQGLLAIGGPAFNDETSFVRTSRRAATQSAQISSLRGESLNCGTLQSLSFTPLDGARREASEIGSLWTDQPVRVLQGREATERIFKQEAPGHRVLHLATHGFFLGTACSPATAGTRSVGGLSTTRQGARSSQPVDNPLLLSGLALAGANRRATAAPGDEDGILTAEEVAALNLQDVEWTVLSACDTGLGEVKAGEGVFGLRRAFQVAGVHTVIMSLWSVDDQATRDWMRALYESRLRDGLDTARAVRQASLGMLAARRARHQSTHPFFWAAFVAAGDWR